MEKEFIPYELALELKKLGFDEPCLMWYNKIELVSNYNKNTESWQSKNTCSAPLYRQVFRWFRQKYDLHSHIRESLGFDYILEFVCQINGTYVLHNHSDKPINRFETYDEAELECLKKLIELIK